MNRMIIKAPNVDEIEEETLEGIMKNFEDCTGFIIAWEIENKSYMVIRSLDPVFLANHIINLTAQHPQIITVINAGIPMKNRGVIEWLRRAFRPFR